MDNRTSYFEYITLLLLVAIIAFWGYFSYEYLPIFEFSDSASDLVLSHHIYTTGNILPTDWYYSTELRVFYYHLVGVLCFFFTDDWHLVRFWENLILNIILATSIIAFLRAINLKENSYLVAAWVLLPISLGYFLVIQLFPAYIPYLAITFYILACLEYFYQGKSTLYLIPAALLAFLASLNGARHLAILTLPYFMLLGFLAVEYFYHNLRRYPFTLCLWRFISENARLIGGTLATGIMSLVGYAINVLYLAKIYTFTEQKAEFELISSEKLLEWGSLLGEVFGRIPQTDGFVAFLAEINVTPSESNLYFAYGFLAVSLLILAWSVTVPNTALRRYAILTCCNIALIVLIGMCTSQAINDRYMYPSLIMLLVLVGAVLGKLGRGKIYSLLFTLLLLLVAKDTASILAGWQDTPPRHYQNRQIIVETLLENGYQSGYASYWFGNIFTVLSNGKLELWVYDGNIANISKWNQLKSHDDTTPTGKVFLLFTKEELEEFPERAKLTADYLIYNDGTYFAYGFSSYHNLRKVVYNEESQE